FFADGRWNIRDSGTLNGTCVDGTRIQQAVPLQDGQVINIGRTFLRFTAESPENGTKTSPDRGLVLDAESPSSLLEGDQTVLCRDELTVLCSFMRESVKESEPRLLIQKALETIHAQVGASITGFLSLDREVPLPKIVLPV